MFKTEIYKIVSRKITLICMAVILLFMLFQVYVSSIGDEAVITGGKSYVRAAAIEKDQDIAAPYEGPLTMEKVNDIWRKYGEPVDYSAEDPHVDLVKGTADLGFEDNYCNRFVGDFFFHKNYDTYGKITYEARTREEVETYLEPDLYFAYAAGWTYYWDAFLTLFILVAILVVIGICPICSEEYALRTADVILATQNGRGRLFGAKTGAALLFSGVVYWGFMGAQFMMYAAAYGIGGLRCSTLFTNSFQFYSRLSLGNTIAVMLLCGWAAVSALTTLVLAVSARSRQTFTSVLWSLSAFLIPPALVLIVLNQLRRTLFNWLVSFLLCSMPSMMFPARFLNFSMRFRLVQGAVLALAGVAFAVYGACRYCRRQV